MYLDLFINIFIHKNNNNICRIVKIVTFSVYKNFFNEKSLRWETCLETSSPFLVYMQYVTFETHISFRYIKIQFEQYIPDNHIHN